MKNFTRVWLAVFSAFNLAAVSAAEDKTPDAKPALESKSSEKLPEAKEVLERFTKALGGAEEYAKYKSQHAIGTVDMPAQNMKGKMEVFAARPNKMVLKVEMAGVGEITTGFDGKVGWMSNPLTGPMLLPDAAVAQLAAQADFDHSLHRVEDYKTIEMLGLEEFEGEPCYKLKLEHKSGFNSTEFFSKKTGLQKGFIATQDSPLGPITVTTVVSDYKKFNGMLMPARTVQKMSGMEQVLTINEMEFNSVPDSTFEVPEAVKALLEKP